MSALGVGPIPGVELEHTLLAELEPLGVVTDGDEPGEDELDVPGSAVVDGDVDGDVDVDTCNDGTAVGCATPGACGPQALSPIIRPAAAAVTVLARITRFIEVLPSPGADILADDRSAVRRFHNEH
ncbi:hypothetical protein V3G39_08135 [Dermatophilaceae bacterium Sec6.4]